MIDYSQFVGTINKRLEIYFDNKISLAGSLDKNYSDFWEIIKKVGLNGGKRLRPCLVILGYLAYGGENVVDIMDIAIAQELMHIALLIHDDVIDKDYLRHNQPNVAGYKQIDYSNLTSSDQSYHLANSVSILAGDLLLAGAYELTYGSLLPNDKKIKALEIVSKSFFEVAGGEYFDTESVLKDFSTDESLKIAKYKTASYSFVYPLMIGASSAGIQDQQVKIIKEFGYALGTAYQLMDDIDGLFGDQKLIGKSNLSDIREAKRTYIMAATFKKSTSHQIIALKKIFGRENLLTEDLLIVQDIVKSSGALKYTIDKIRELIELASSNLNTLEIDNQYRPDYLFLEY